MNTNQLPHRPDLSFITSQSFKDKEAFTDWYYNLPNDKREIVLQFQTTKLPKVISFLEMYFDSMVGKPEQQSLIFALLSELLQPESSEFELEKIEFPEFPKCNPYPNGNYCTTCQTKMNASGFKGFFGRKFCPDIECKNNR